MLLVRIALLSFMLALGACAHPVVQAPAGTTERAASHSGVRAGHYQQALDTTAVKRLSARYLLHLPRDYGRDPSRRWPLILYLHGGSRRGADLDSVRVWGLPKLVEQDPSFPFIVVSPQAAPGTLWTDTDLLAALLDEVAARYAVDRTRVYLTGHSMGGNGTWYLAYAHPERFAAIAPMSGPANPWWAARLRAMPTWVFHGAQDSIVPIHESEDMVRALREEGNQRVRFTALPDREHGLLDLYEDPGSELYTWFLQHRRP